MLKFDKAVFQKVVVEHNGFYRRYSDDMVIVCNESKKSDIQDFLIKEIDKYNLEIAKSKTEVCAFKYITEKGKQVLKVHKIINGKEKYNVPFNYLGFEFYGNKTLIKSSNLAKFYRRMKKAVKTKAKRIKIAKEKYLLEETSLFKRKIYRIYSHFGQKPKGWEVIRRRLKKNYNTGEFQLRKIKKKRDKKKPNHIYRGNYLYYVHRASQIMNEPAIKKQLRNHWKILQDYIRKYINTNNMMSQ